MRLDGRNGRLAGPLARFGRGRAPDPRPAAARIWSATRRTRRGASRPAASNAGVALPRASLVQPELPARSLPCSACPYSVPDEGIYGRILTEVNRLLDRCRVQAVHIS